MQKSSLAHIAVTTILLTSSTHAEEKAMSVPEVLKHTPEKLAQVLGNTSEAGEDQAAQLWATAKRIQTESLLGKKSILAVRRLAQWRRILNTWDDLQLQARSIESGGGTLWGHMSARNDAWIEDFLAKNKEALSAERINSGKAFESDYLKIVNAQIDAGLKEFGEDNAFMREHAVTLKEELKNAYLNLQYVLKTLPDGDLRNEIIRMTKPETE